jgi:[acyl-carrier-protein] S-malonyltransferase
VTSRDLAFVFPGQGAERADMLDAVRRHPRFAEKYDAICRLVGRDLESALHSGEEALHANAMSSLATFLVSSIALDEFRETAQEDAGAVGGYSVGQWTALYAAGCLTFADTARIIAQRAQYMDACFADRPGAMMAVIGSPLERIRRFCEDLSAQGHMVHISNVNCPGQYSLAGATSAIEAALERADSLEAKIVKRLPARGAWHCRLVRPAERPFRLFLRTVTLQPARVAIINNVTGDWFPHDATAIKAHLVRHLSRPVLWERGVRRLVESGCRRLVEIGFGNMLTKSGFFIDRTVSHSAFLPGK